MITKAFQLWKKYCSDPVLKEELDSLIDDANRYDCFYTTLKFGTGGLRGLMGVGTNRMNIYTVRQATQGIANVLVANKKNLKVVIGYDSRNNSHLFAKEVAQVLLKNQIVVYFFDDLRPTPEVSFAVRELKCDLGIVITASHNPKEYNGYKVYGSDGGQITEEIATLFANSIHKINPFDVRIRNFEDTKSSKNLIILNQSFDNIYLSKILELDITSCEYKRDSRIIYTPLHGSAFKLIDQVLKLKGYTNVHYVTEQVQPNGDFPTVKSPNPEEAESLAMAISLARKIDGDIVLGTDPDGDRVGIAVRNGLEMDILNGNQVGVLLVNFLLEASKTINSKTAIIKTIVTSDLGKKIAEAYGITVFETLTGFKYIGEKIKEFEENSTYNFLLGYEESYGYLSGTFVRDKDAVIATLLICEMFSYYKSRGINLHNKLDQIYQKYGYAKEKLHSYTYKGEDGFSKIQSNVNLFRDMDFITTHFSDILSVEDYSTSSRIFKDGNIENIDLPRSNVIKIRFEDDSWFAIRPSGTEPKLKIYISVFSKNKEDIDLRYQNISNKLKNLLDLKY